MKTFLNLYEEFGKGPSRSEEEIERQLKGIMKNNLMVRISLRGQKEQYASIFYPHYYPNVGKLKSKNTSCKNNRFFCNC